MSICSVVCGLAKVIVPKVFFFQEMEKESFEKEKPVARMCSKAIRIIVLLEYILSNFEILQHLKAFSHVRLEVGSMMLM